MPADVKPCSGARRTGRRSPPALLRELERLARSLPDRNHLSSPVIPLPPPALPRALRCFQRSSTANIHHRAHVNPDSFVLLIGLRGSADIGLDEVTVSFHAGDAVLFFPNQFHRYTKVSEPMLWVFLNFTANESDWLPLKYSVTALTPPLWRHVFACLDLYLGPERDTPYAAGGMAVECWRLLMGLVACQDERPSAQILRRDIPQPYYQTIRKALRFIMANLHAPITVGDVARHAGISSTALQAAFHKFQPYGVGEVIRRQRVSLAARLMNASDDSLKSIAAKCGFSSPHVFSRSFKKITGQSPARYRAQLRSLR